MERSLSSKFCRKKCKEKQSGHWNCIACCVCSLEEVKDLEYRRVTFRGEFDHSKEMLVGPRSNVLKDGGGLMSAGNQTGANIVTPFKLADREWAAASGFLEHYFVKIQTYKRLRRMLLLYENRSGLAVRR